MVNITKIELLIKEKGWSKKYFCDLFDHSRTWIDDWKRGVGVPKDNLLQAIADKLDTNVDYLTDKTDIKRQKNKPAAKSDELSPQDRKIIDLIQSLSPEKKRIALAQLEAMSKLPDNE